jgi:hypothetical protein
VDESAEEIATSWTIRPVERNRVSAIGRDEVERAVRPVFVVVTAVDAEQLARGGDFRG